MKAVSFAALVVAACIPPCSYAEDMRLATAQGEFLRPGETSPAPDNARRQQGIWTKAPADSRLVGIAAIAPEEVRYLSGCSH